MLVSQWENGWTRGSGNNLTYDNFGRAVSQKGEYTTFLLTLKTLRQNLSPLWQMRCGKKRESCRRCIWYSASCVTSYLGH
jgi:hypothetical protein